MIISEKTIYFTILDFLSTLYEPKFGDIILHKIFIILLINSTKTTYKLSLSIHIRLEKECWFSQIKTILKRTADT